MWDAVDTHWSRIGRTEGQHETIQPTDDKRERHKMIQSEIKA